MKILAVSDTQIGAGASLTQNRLADQEAVLNQIADLADSHQVDLVLHAGDVFEHRHPSEEARMVFKRFTDRVRADRRLVVVAGNHDLSNADTASAVDVHGIDFVRRAALIDVGHATLACLPWAPTGRLIAGLPTVPRDEVNALAADMLTRAAQDLHDEAPAGRPVILATHWWLSGASTATGTTETFSSEPVLDVNALASMGFAAVIAGHVHKPQILHVKPPVVMCGPPVVCNFGEAETEHGVWLFDTDQIDEVEFVPIDDRRFVTVEVDLTQDSSVKGAASQAREEGPRSPTPEIGTADDQGPGMRAPNPAPSREMEASEDVADALEDRRLASMGGIDPAQTQGSVSRSGLSASDASSVFDETDVLASAIIATGNGHLDGSVLRLRYTATEEQHRRVNAAELRSFCDRSGVHKLYTIEPTIVRPARARVEGFDRDLTGDSALAVWCEANEIPEDTAEALHGVLWESRETSATSGAGAAFDPLTLTGRNIGRFADLHIDFQDGASVLLGPNGTGKSTILNALELALYAEDGGDLREFLSPWADDLELELTFTLDGVDHRVRRALRGVKRSATNVLTGGKATLDLERERLTHPGDGTSRVLEAGWEPLTLETTKATQKRLVELIGMSRQLFRASCFLAQGDGPAFLTADPADRKALAAELLDPAGLWKKDAAHANAQAKTIDSEIAAARTRIAALTETADLITALDIDLSLARDERDAASQGLAEAEQVLERELADEAGNAAAAERVRTATVERETAAYAVDVAAQKSEHAQAEAAKLPAAREKLAGLEARGAEIPGLEAAAEAYRTAALRADTSRREKQAAASASRVQRSTAEEAHRETERAITARETAKGRLSHLEQSEDGVERCATCEQLLGAEARAAAIRATKAEVARAEETVAEKAATRTSAMERLRELDAIEAAIEIPTVVETDPGPRLAEARAAVERVATGRLLIQGYEELATQVNNLVDAHQSATTILEEKQQALEQASAAVKDPAELAATVRNARTVVEMRHRSHTASVEAVTRLEERHRTATEARDQAAALTKEISERQERLDLYRLAEKAFGRDGIPVLLLETVLPQIDADANTILRRFPTADGWTFSVRFETQREQASTDRLREELYVMVDAPDYPQDYRSLSGGEDSRVSFAIRVALAMLLGRLRGADSRLLVLDELPFLDEAAEDTLVQLVNELVTDGTFSKVLTVSHSPAVRDAFHQTIEIEKTDGRSAIAGDREPVLA